jgi:hypothetical protein
MYKRIINMVPIPIGILEAPSAGGAVSTIMGSRLPAVLMQATSILEDAATAILMLVLVVLFKIIFIVKMLLAILTIAMTSALDPMFLQSNPTVEVLIAFGTVKRVLARVTPVPAAAFFGGENTVARATFVPPMSPRLAVVLLESVVALEDTVTVFAVVMATVSMGLKPVSAGVMLVTILAVVVVWTLDVVLFQTCPSFEFGVASGAIFAALYRPVSISVL